MSTKPKPTVIPFRQATRAAAPAMALPLAVGMAGVPEPTPLPTAIDLSGKRKIWFLIGRGRIGKTTFARWLCETVEQRGGSAVFAAADPTNRSLRTYLDDVTEPPSADPDEAVAWFRDLLQFTTAQQANAVIDLGGGNTMLETLLADVPDLVDTLSAGGVEPVAIHLIGPHPHDLVPLATMEQAGFKPAATAIICNEAHGRRARFGDVLDQPIMHEALDRGTVQLWMPQLASDAARQCDTMAWTYHEALDKAGLLTASAVRSWLRRMDTELAPIMSWLPA